MNEQTALLGVVFTFLWSWMAAAAQWVPNVLLHALRCAQRGTPRAAAWHRKNTCSQNHANQQPSTKNGFHTISCSYFYLFFIFILSVQFLSFYAVDSPVWVNMLCVTLNSKSNNNDSNSNNDNNDNNTTNNTRLKVLCNMLRGSCWQHQPVNNSSSLLWFPLRGSCCGWCHVFLWWSNEPAVPRSIHQLKGPAGGPSRKQKQLLTISWITGKRQSCFVFVFTDW